MAQPLQRTRRSVSGADFVDQTWARMSALIDRVTEKQRKPNVVASLRASTSEEVAAAPEFQEAPVINYPRTSLHARHRIQVRDRPGAPEDEHRLRFSKSAVSSLP
jgi:hypothetical protein